MAPAPVVGPVMTNSLALVPEFAAVRMIFVVTA
jgi:hypothetical protein